MEYTKIYVRLDNYLFKRIEMFAKFSIENSPNKYLENMVFKKITAEEFNNIRKVVFNATVNKKIVMKNIEKITKENNWVESEIFEPDYRKQRNSDIYKCKNCNEELTKEELEGKIECPSCLSKITQKKPYSLRIDKEVMENYKEVAQELSLDITNIIYAMVIYHIVEIENLLEEGIFKIE